MHYYLYEIRNNINGKIYVGVHKTKVLDDGYMGSGKIIKSAIKKHGIQNFTKTILEYFESQEEMFAREKEIVTEEFLLREDTYNLRRGGNGGWDYINKNITKEQLQVRGRLGGQASALVTDHRYIITEEHRRKINSRLNELNVGVAHNQAARLKGSENARLVNTGSILINNGLVNKRIKKDELIPAGWTKGRKPINI